MVKNDRFLTVKKAAEFLCVSPNTVRNWGAAWKSSGTDIPSTLPIIQTHRPEEAEAGDRTTATTTTSDVGDQIVMDSARAKYLSDELIGKQVGGLEVVRLLGAGKSAIVLEANDGSQQSALKVFDPELVECFGKDTQLQRIEREKQLIGKHHENLVQILDGGECASTGYLFVVMELIEAPNLADSITLVPKDRIASILSQIADAARYLEGLGLAHRDIKPENIALLPDFSRAVLLDLGVLRPFGDGDLTDVYERVFVGTLRYSSPELLLREEVDDQDGWRAVTFYQLGGVLHDMIMRRPLFQEFTSPFSLLVEAVKSEEPCVHAPDVSQDLVLLAQNCLAKVPATRLELIDWDSFRCAVPATGTAFAARRRVEARELRQRAIAPAASTNVASVSERQIAQKVVSLIENAIRTNCASARSFPRMRIVSDDIGAMRVTVSFGPAPNLGLLGQLAIEFHAVLLDNPSPMISLVAAASIAKKSELLNL